MLVKKLEELIEKWRSVPYNGDLTQATYNVCAEELIEILENYADDLEPRILELEKGLQERDKKNYSCIITFETPRQPLYEETFRAYDDKRNNQLCEFCGEPLNLHLPGRGCL